MQATWLDKHFKGDRTIWLIVFVLSIYSLLAVYSSTGTLAYQYQGGYIDYYLCYHMFIGRISMKFIFAMAGVGVICFAIFILVALATGHTGRIETWKSRIERFSGSDESDNYQTEQAKIAIARGGLVGTFPGNSVQ